MLLNLSLPQVKLFLMTSCTVFKHLLAAARSDLLDEQFRITWLHFIKFKNIQKSSPHLHQTLDLCSWRVLLKDLIYPHNGITENFHKNLHFCDYLHNLAICFKNTKYYLYLPFRYVGHELDLLFLLWRWISKYHISTPDLWSPLKHWWAKSCPLVYLRTAVPWESSTPQPVLSARRRKQVGDGTIHISHLPPFTFREPPLLSHTPLEHVRCTKIRVWGLACMITEQRIPIP